MPMTDMAAVPQRTDGMAMPAPQGGGLGQGPAPEQQQAGPMGFQQAAPEEQDLYDRFVGRALQLIYSDEMNPKILDMLDGGAGEGAEGDPADGLAQATAMIVARVGAAAEQAGQQLSPDVVLHAGTEIFEDLANLSKVAKIKDYTQDKEAFQRAYFGALDHYRNLLQGAGEIDQQSAQGDYEKLQQMDAEGKLDPLFRKLASDDAAREGANQNEPPAPQSDRRGLMG